MQKKLVLFVPTDKGLIVLNKMEKYPLIKYEKFRLFKIMSLDGLYLKCKYNRAEENSASLFS